MSEVTERVTLKVRRRASDWARSKLDFEGNAPDAPGLKQITVRMPAEDVAFVDALATRFGVSRNEAIGIFVGSAAADAYEQLPRGDQKSIVTQVSKSVGRPVAVRWVRELDLSEEREIGVPDETIERMKAEADFSVDATSGANAPEVGDR